MSILRYAFLLKMGDLDNTYDRRGVSSSKQEVHAAIASLDKGLYPHAFCKVLPDYLGNDEAYANVFHADGAGTKASLAYVYWRETGDCSVWEGVAQDAIVMNLNDLLCVGVCHQPILFSSIIGRNKAVIPAAVLAALITGSETFLSSLRSMGIATHLAGGETADIGDLVRSVVVDNTSVTRIARKNILSNHNIRPGNVVVGMASFGKASYEPSYNSGIGSNGLTAARHELFHKKYAERYPESFADSLQTSLCYTGKYDVEQIITHLASHDHTTTCCMPIGKWVLSPTRTYMPIFKDIFPQYTPKIHGMIHCTGGGQTKVLHFLRKHHVIKDQLFDPPPLFQLIKEEGRTPWKEMYEVFNMGHLLEIYTDADTAQVLIQAASQYQVAAKIIGHVEESPVPKLSLRHPFFGEITYER